MFKNKKCRELVDGFTLIEIIIVITLTMILMTITIQGFANTSSQFSFNNEAEKIQAMIRTARSLAISGKAQPDYTDYNKNGCYDGAYQNPDACPPGGDFVTPANYGVVFHSGGYVSLFVDNHSSNAANWGKEGQYGWVDGTVDSYRKGWDIFLEQYKIPEGMNLITPESSSAIFYSPVFADVGSEPTLDPAKPFFIFGISQKQGALIRKRCWQIHMLSGISEPITEGLTDDPLKCP